MRVVSLQENVFVRCLVRRRLSQKVKLQATNTEFCLAVPKLRTNNYRNVEELFWKTVHSNFKEIVCFHEI